MRRPAGRRGRSAPPDRRRARCPAPPRRLSPPSTSELTSARSPGRSQTRPCVRPVSAPTGFVAALKMTFRHCAGRASATASVGIPARVQASARAAISSAPAGLGSNGPSVVSPLTSHCTTPGSTIFPAGNVVPRITRETWRATTSSFPTPFWTVATAPSAKAWAVAASAPSVCIAFVATIPKSHGGRAAASVVARRWPRTSPAPVSRSPFAFIASTWAWETSYAHTSTSSRVARFAAKSDPTAPQPTMQTLISPPLPARAARAAAARTRARR